MPKLSLLKQNYFSVYHVAQSSLFMLKQAKSLKDKVLRLLQNIIRITFNTMFTLHY